MSLYLWGGDREPKIMEPKIIKEGNYSPSNELCVYEGVKNSLFRIRKLTPRECFRLMAVSEKDIDTIQAAGISNSQQYKLAGNSIVVDVLYYIFKKMFVDKGNDNQELTLF